jgi:hypothetical protein
MSGSDSAEPPRWLSWFRALRARATFNRTNGRHPGVLIASEEGVEFFRYRFRQGAAVLETEWRFGWAEVSGIFGYKIDLLVVDQIRLAFEVEGGVTRIVTEDMAGFESLKEVLSLHFEGMKGSWWLETVFPAFEPTG